MRQEPVPTQIVGEVRFPDVWTVFTDPAPRTPTGVPGREAALAKMRTADATAPEDPALTAEVLRSIPHELVIKEHAWKARRVAPLNSQFDFRPLLGAPPFAKGSLQSPDCVAWGRVAYAFLPIQAEAEDEVDLGMGADGWLRVWLNGEMIFDGFAESMKTPPAINDYVARGRVKAGVNILVAKFVSGKGSSVLALGGPYELRAQCFDSILTDPLLSADPAWTRPELRAAPGSKAVADIGVRRELFVDDFLVDRLAGGAERRLHHPVPREVVLWLNKPWEAPVKRYFSVVEHEGRVRLYYGGRPSVACMAESDDGIHFTRPELGLHAFEGSTRNNIVWGRGKSGHNFTPFKDLNPAATPERRFKAVGDHPDGGGLAAFASADGIHWSLMSELPVLAEGAFDSQNLAFWDAERGLYRCYCRGFDETGTSPRRGVRDIRWAVSEDFLNWSRPRFVEYTDDRPEHMYTNCVRPYFRAPHLYIGTPLRFVPLRKKLPDYDRSGLGDAVLMSSRDGRVFDRWHEAFISPGPLPENWSDRMCEPAWGMVQRSPEEMTLYWLERRSNMDRCLRRGTLRTDGFVSLHAGGEVGELLTRPLVFSGACLEVNYRTSAIGLVRFELCDGDGKPIDGLSLTDSEPLFGDEVSHLVCWKGSPHLSRLAGRPVRLRVRLQDADLYSFRFAPEE